MRVGFNFGDRFWSFLFHVRILNSDKMAKKIRRIERFMRQKYLHYRKKFIRNSLRKKVTSAKAKSGKRLLKRLEMSTGKVGRPRKAILDDDGGDYIPKSRRNDDEEEVRSKRGFLSPPPSHSKFGKMNGGGSARRDRNTQDKPAELFRKDLISAMKLADSDHLEPDEYVLIQDPWRQDWEKGVQVPVNEDCAPEIRIRFLEENVNLYGSYEFKLPKKFLYAMKDDNFKSALHEIHETQKLAEQVCRYDLDDIDVNWLQVYNDKREDMGENPIEEWQMEKVMECLETVCFNNLQNKIKTEEGLGIEYDETVVCDVCRSPDSEEGNEMVFCDSCDICVHQACYGITAIPEGSWLCRVCALGIKPVCLLCPKAGGAMKSTKSGSKWAHVSCALWIPEVSIGCPEKMEPITKISQVPASRWALSCSVCREKEGACIQCCVKTCKTAFHVTCAFAKHLDMKTELIDDSDDVQLRAYCEKHTRRGGQSPRKDGSVTPYRNRPGCSTPNRLALGSSTPTINYPGSPMRNPGSPRPIGSPSRRRELTEMEKNEARSQRLAELEDEFMCCVTPEEVATDLGYDIEMVDFIWSYWILKRKTNFNAPFLMPKTEEEDMLSKQREDSLIARMKMFIHLRQDLERVRNLCYMLGKREKTRRELYRSKEKIFKKQAELATSSQMPRKGTREYTAVLEAHKLKDSFYDQYDYILDMARQLEERIFSESLRSTDIRPRARIKRDSKDIKGASVSKRSESIESVSQSHENDNEDIDVTSVTSCVEDEVNLLPVDDIESQIDDKSEKKLDAKSVEKGSEKGPETSDAGKKDSNSHNERSRKGNDRRRSRRSNFKSRDTSESESRERDSSENARIDSGDKSENKAKTTKDEDKVSRRRSRRLDTGDADQSPGPEKASKSGKSSPKRDKVPEPMDVDGGETNDEVMDYEDFLKLSNSESEQKTKHEIDKKSTGDSVKKSKSESSKKSSKTDKGDSKPNNDQKPRRNLRNSHTPDDGTTSPVRSSPKHTDITSSPKHVGVRSSPRHTPSRSDHKASPRHHPILLDIRSSPERDVKSPKRDIKTTPKRNLSPEKSEPLKVDVADTSIEITGVTSPTTTPSKRGRGRPRKYKSASELISQQQPSQSSPHIVGGSKSPKHSPSEKDDHSPIRDSQKEKEDSQKVHPKSKLSLKHNRHSLPVELDNKSPKKESDSKEKRSDSNSKSPVSSHRAPRRQSVDSDTKSLKSEINLKVKDQNPKIDLDSSAEKKENLVPVEPPKKEKLPCLTKEVVRRTNERLNSNEKNSKKNQPHGAFHIFTRSQLTVPDSIKQRVRGRYTAAIELRKKQKSVVCQHAQMTLNSFFKPSDRKENTPQTPTSPEKQIALRLLMGSRTPRSPKYAPPESRSHPNFESDDDSNIGSSRSSTVGPRKRSLPTDFSGSGLRRHIRRRLNPDYDSGSDISSGPCSPRPDPEQSDGEWVPSNDDDSDDFAGSRRRSLRRKSSQVNNIDESSMQSTASTGSRYSTRSSLENSRSHFGS